MDGASALLLEMLNLSGNRLDCSRIRISVIEGQRICVTTRPADTTRTHRFWVYLVVQTYLYREHHREQHIERLCFGSTRLKYVLRNILLWVWNGFQTTTMKGLQSWRSERSLSWLACSSECGYFLINSSRQFPLNSLYYFSGKVQIGTITVSARKTTKGKLIKIHVINVFMSLVNVRIITKRLHI